MSLVEGSLYDHDHYGRVELETLTDETARFACEDDTVFVSDVGQIPRVVTEPRETFERLADPADIVIEPPATEASPMTPTPMQ